MLGREGLPLLGEAGIEVALPGQDPAQPLRRSLPVPDAVQAATQY